MTSPGPTPPPSLNLVDPDKDPNRFNPDVHYRVYDSPRSGPCVVCMQDFDYLDTDGTRFLSYNAYTDEADAERELRAFAATIGQLASRLRASGLL